MKSVLLCVAFACVAALSGCSQIQAKVNTDVQAATVPDITAALAAANAATPPDTVGAGCWTQVLSFLQSLPTEGANAPAPQIIGVASALEASRGLNVGAPIVLPVIPEALHIACAPVVLDAQTTAAKLGLTGAALVHGVPVARVLLKP